MGSVAFCRREALPGAVRRPRGLQATTRVITLGTYPTSPAARRDFASGELRDYWAARYPVLFDKKDLALAHNQPKNHFFEWLAAIVIFESTGWLSLVEKYQFPKKHPHKYAIFAELVPETVRHLLVQSRFLGDRQGPDLFVYSPDQTDWYFCEVKGGSDRVRDSQSAVFAILERLSGRAVRLITFTDRHSTLPAAVDGAQPLAEALDDRRPLRLPRRAGG